jgi:carboxypeptidase C (cathepsin A)
MLLFMQSFPSFKGREFHMAGESYGGRYIPVFASRLVHHNQQLLHSNSVDKQAINLTSVLIGNGYTDIVTMASSYYDQACTQQNGLGRPVLDIARCIEMQQAVKRCDKWLQKVCRDR